MDRRDFLKLSGGALAAGAVAAAGEPAFMEMLARQGGAGRAERRRRWLDDNIEALRTALR